MPPIGEGSPNRSTSMGCNPSQVKEFNENLKKHGVKCGHYMPDGRLETTSDKSRNQVLKAMGLRDNQAGYSQHPGE
jgi:hypothetical protein